jgi:hypothetical protein
VNRAPRTGPRLVAERKIRRKRERERERKKTTEAGEAAGTVDTVDTADTAKTTTGANKKRRRHNRITEASKEAEDVEDAATQQLITEQVTANRSAVAVPSGPTPFNATAYLRVYRGRLRLLRLRRCLSEDSCRQLPP